MVRRLGGFERENSQNSLLAGELCRSRVSAGIADFNQIKSFGWGGRAAGAAIPRGECLGDVARKPAAKPDQLQGPRHVAHLMVQKGARPRFDVDLLARAPQPERVEGAHRRVCLTQGIAKRREIVVPQEMPRPLAHCFEIERRSDVPDPAALDCRRRPPIQNAVEINTAGRREPRIEALRRWLRRYTLIAVGRR